MLGKFSKLLRLISVEAYRRGLFRGAAAAIEHDNAIRSLTIGSLVDVGANKGQFSLVVRRWHPEAIIHAFEPLDEPAAVYERVFAGDDKVHFHRVAVGAETGESAIHVSARMDSSSLLPIAARQVEVFPGTGEVAQRFVPVVRADDVLPVSDLSRPIFVKLDVQGFELTALHGMPELLKRADHIYTEVSFLPLYDGQALAHELTEFLTAAGFAFSGVHNVVSMKDGRAIQADLLFSRLATT